MINHTGMKNTQCRKFDAYFDTFDTFHTYTFEYRAVAATT